MNFVLGALSTVDALLDRVQQGLKSLWGLPFETNSKRINNGLRVRDPGGPADLFLHLLLLVRSLLFHFTFYFQFIDIFGFAKGNKCLSRVFPCKGGQLDNMQ